MGVAVGVAAGGAAGGAAAVPLANAPTLRRERNGWCVPSAQIWLALELKGAVYVEERVSASDAPMLVWPDGATQSESLAALRAIDVAFPFQTALWPSCPDARASDASDDNTDPEGSVDHSAAAAATDEMIERFAAALPEARRSTRAPHLFSPNEGFAYDPLPRATFVATLDALEVLLGGAPSPVPPEPSERSSRSPERSSRTPSEEEDASGRRCRDGGPFFGGHCAVGSRCARSPPPRAVLSPAAVLAQRPQSARPHALATSLKVVRCDAVRGAVCVSRAWRWPQLVSCALDCAVVACRVCGAGRSALKHGMRLGAPSFVLRPPAHPPLRSYARPLPAHPPLRSYARCPPTPCEQLAGARRARRARRPERRRARTDVGRGGGGV